MTDEELNFIINAKNNADKAFKEVEGGIGKIQKSMEDMKPAFQKVAATSAIVFGAIVTEIGFAIKAYTDSETAMARVDQSLSNIQKTSKMTTEAMGKVKDSIMKVSKSAIQLGFDDEDAAESMTKFYERTRDVTEATKLSTLAMDLARAKNIDLATATTLVNQVLSGNGKVLKQYGIDIKDSATPLEATNVLLEKVGGQSTKFVDTLAGKMEIIKVQFGNMQEAIGKPFADVMSGMLTALNPYITKIGEWIEQNPMLTTAILVITGALAGLTTAVGVLALAVIAFQAVSWPIVGFVALWTVGITLLVVAIGLAVYWIVTHWTYLSDMTWKILTGIWDTVKLMFRAVETSVKDAMNNVFNFLKAIWDSINNIFRDSINTLLDTFKPLLDVIQRVQDGLSMIGGAVNKGASAVGNAFNIPFLKVKDAIIQPNGQVIQTDPADYLIATKNPGALAGNGGGLVININGGYFLSETVAEDLGDLIMTKIKRNMKI